MRLKDNRHRWDTTYPGVEILPDGTFVATTYGHWIEGEEPYILSVRFRLDELDAMAERGEIMETAPAADSSVPAGQSSNAATEKLRAPTPEESLNFKSAGVIEYLPLEKNPKRSEAQRKNMPNVLFIAADDWNDWIGCLGYEQAITPNVDRLAERGVLFSNAHCAVPVCNPSRVAVMTGLRADTTGVHENGTPMRRAVPDVVTLSQHFMQHGYEVHGGGKIYHDPPGFHDFQGFNSYFWWHPDGSKGGIRGGRRYSPYSNPPDPELPGRPTNNIASKTKRNFDWGAPDRPESDWPDYRAAQWASDFLAQDHDRPFFLAVGMFRPHVPWFNPKKYFDQYPLDKLKLPEVKEDDVADLGEWARNRALDGASKHDLLVENGEWKQAVQAYLASITHADANLGRVLDALDNSQYRDNTIIVFWSDHGYHLGEKGHWHKRTLWERATHVPLVISAPGVTRPGGVCAEAVNLLDLYPTLIDLCGLDQRPELDGQSLLPSLRNPKAIRDEPSVITYLAGNHAVRDERWRYIRYETGEEELYDHDADPHEWDNLADRAEFDDVKRQLEKWIPAPAAKEE